MSNTPSPTPSEDNRRNVRHESASRAIDRAMNTKEQSREDLLNSFTFLEKADIDKASTKHSIQQDTDRINSIMTSILSKRQDQSFVSSFKKKMVVDQKLTDQSIVKVDSDGIEEEVLDGGSASSRLSSARIIKTGTNLKVDNFVDDEEQDSTDMNDGYVASFREDQSESQKHKVSKPSVDNRKAAPTPPADFASSLSIDENSTDKLLLNFLADLQNEQNARRSRAIQDHITTNTSSPTSNPTDSSEDSIDKFIKQNKRKEDTVDFSSDDDEAVMSLVDNSNETGVKVVVKQDDLDELAQSCDENKVRTKQTRMVMDSEGNMSEETINSDNTDHAEPISNVVFPGEIVTEDSTFTESPATCTNERLLDFKAIYKTSAESDPSNCNQDAVQESTDEVEAFHLDPDFDYDNVVLTPKYSAADMERLQNMFQMKTKVM